MSDDGEGGWGRSLSMRVVVDRASRCVVGIEVEILRCRDEDEATTSSGFVQSTSLEACNMGSCCSFFNCTPCCMGYKWE